MSSDLLNIMLFTGARVRYGAEEHMLTLLRELSRKDFRLYMACPSELAQAIRHDVPPDVQLFEVPLGQKGRFQKASQFARLLKENRIDVLHSHMSFSSRFASPIGWFCRVPIVLETPHVAENWRKGWLTSSYLPDRIFGKFVDYFIAVSEANGRYLIDKKGLPEKKVVVVRNGCDLTRFKAASGDRSALRRKFGYSDGDPILIVPARLEPQKGHSVLIEAVPMIYQQFPNLKVLCLGEGSLRSELERTVAKKGLQSIVHFLGFQAEIRDWFALGDLTVLSSFYEGLPLVAIESLAASRAVVATHVDGTPEVVVNNLSGLTVPPGQPAPLAEAICSLLKQPALIEHFGTAGRKLVETEFSQTRQVERTADLYLRARTRRESKIGR